MNSKVKEFLEGIVIFAIILVLVQTLLEDVAVLLGWTWTIRKILIVSGFCFDLFFTLEFLSRFYAAFSTGELKTYLLDRRGWIDFVASVPLLILNSGPALFTVLAGSGMVFSMGGILNILKIVKTVRIARILRLLRVLKIFKQIKNINSPMAQRHMMKITSMAITTLVFTLFGYSLLTSLIGLPQSDTILLEEQQRMVEAFSISVEKNGAEYSAEVFGKVHEDLLIVKEGGNTLFSRSDNDYFSENFGPGDYNYLEDDGFGFFFNLHRVQMLESRNNLMYFFIVILLTIGLLFVYSPHFAMTVTDPIHVMLRGFNEKDYNYEVKVQERFKSDDIFKLALSYNENFLPMKDLQNQSSESNAEDLELKMDDLGDLFS